MLRRTANMALHLGKGVVCRGSVGSGPSSVAAFEEWAVAGS